MSRPRPTLAVAAALLLTCCATALAGGSWVRSEGKWFVWYAPDATWVHDESANGIDVTSATGEMTVGFGFSGWTSPLTVNDVVTRYVQLGGLDDHPVSNLRLAAAGPPVANGPAVRQTFTWTAFRTDTRESSRGVFQAEVFNSPATGVYGFDVHARSAPAAVWSQVAPTLALIQQRIFFKPHTQSRTEGALGAADFRGHVVGLTPCRGSLRPCRRG